MSLEILDSFLLWFAVINLGLLICWFLFASFADNWTWRRTTVGSAASGCRLTPSTRAAWVFYKLSACFYNTVPWIVLQFFSRSTKVQYSTSFPKTAIALLEAMDCTGDTNRADPISAQTLTVTPIGYGGPVFGIIGDANDFIDGENGRRSDFFGFSVTDPLPRYVVTARSETFAAASTLYFADEATGTLSLQQSANVWALGRQVQYSGTVPRAGTYLIEVHSIGGSHGGYTVSLGNGGTAACDVPGTNSPFVEISPGVALNCTLSADAPISLQSETGKHYAKGFHFIGNGESVKIRAASGAFVPVIARIDRDSGQVLESGQGELSGAFTGDVFYVVSTAKPAVTGAFTTDIVAGTTAGGTARAPGALQSLDTTFHYVIEY